MDISFSYPQQLIYGQHLYKAINHFLGKRIFLLATFFLDQTHQGVVQLNLDRESYFFFLKNIFGICKKGEPCTDCGTVLLAGYISEREAAGDPVTCSSVKPEWSSDVYAVIRDCNNNLVTLCGTGDGNETLTINPSDLLEAGEYCS